MQGMDEPQLCRLPLAQDHASGTAPIRHLQVHSCRCSRDTGDPGNSCCGWQLSCLCYGSARGHHNPRRTSPQSQQLQQAHPEIVSVLTLLYPAASLCHTLLSTVKQAFPMPSIEWAAARLPQQLMCGRMSRIQVQCWTPLLLPCSCTACDSERIRRASSRRLTLTCRS